MNIADFPCINFKITSIKQNILNKQGSTHKDTCYK